MVRPLSGVTLVEIASPGVAPGLTAAIALCGRLAADLGAQVSCLVHPDSQPAPFLWHGKQILRAADPAALLATLAPQAHGLICDQSALATLLTPPRVCAVISMDGTESGDTTQSEFTIEARAGLLDVVGDPARQPLRLGGHQTSYAAGLAAFTGLAAALGRPGPGRVRASLLETAVWLNWKGLAVDQRTGKSPHRPGSNAEWPVLPCADGHVVVVHRVQEWQRLKQLTADPLLDEDRFQTVPGRRQHRAELNAALARCFARLTRAEIHAAALRHKLPLGPVWSPDELRHDPQTTSRAMLITTEVEGHPITLPRLPVLWREGAA